MPSPFQYGLATALVALLSVGVQLLAALPDKKRAEPASFGIFTATDADAARAQALDWLKRTSRAGDKILHQFNAIWSSDRSLLDKVADSLALGDADAAKLLAQARDSSTPVPTAMPALLTDNMRPAFYRANLALAYAKGLSDRRVYEESLEVLRIIKPEQVVDPAAYFFSRAVAEHALLLRNEARQSIRSLLEDVPAAPERYKVLALLMDYDLQTWRDRDLGEIARKMNNIERRLGLARGGPQTQKLQREVINRLDELIKRLEDASDRSNQGSPIPGGRVPRYPLPDSQPGGPSGPGNIKEKELRHLAGDWGKLPDKEQIRAFQELTRQMPSRYREVTEEYLKALARVEARPK